MHTEHDQRTTRSGNRMKVDQGLDEVMSVLKELRHEYQEGRVLKYAVTQCTRRRFTYSSERPEWAVLRISLSIVA